MVRIASAAFACGALLLVHTAVGQGPQGSGTAPPGSGRPGAGSVDPNGPARSPVEAEVQEFQLANGLRFLVVERHFAPVFSFVTLVDAGGSDEEAGKTGTAHMMEHMAFKGTPTIGTTDAKAEAAALVKVDQDWAEVERQKLLAIVSQSDTSRMQQALEAFNRDQEEALRYSESNAFSKVLDENGAQNLNAFTTTDQTAYFYSLPSNKLELWALLEGDRMTYPVFREFYKEREVVIEERRINTESSPRGRLSDEVWKAAFTAHPYRNGVIGFRSDLETFGRPDAERFFREHYTAANMVVVVVGDVKVGEVRRLAEKYFSEIPRGTKSLPVPTVEPEPNAERMVRSREAAQPMVFAAYWGGPSITDPDYLAVDALMDVLASGRSSRLYTNLVKNRKVAVSVSARAGFPGEKYPNLCWFSCLPAPGVAPDTLLSALDEELRSVQQHPITEAELEAYRNRARAGFIEGLHSNSGLAMQLAYYQIRTGDWRNLFRWLERIDQVKPEQVTAEAARILIPKHRTAGIMETVEETSSRPQQKGGNQ